VQGQLQSQADPFYFVELVPCSPFIKLYDVLVFIEFRAQFPLFSLDHPASQTNQNYHENGSSDRQFLLKFPGSLIKSYLSRVLILMISIVAL